jgi:hypothetical protein
VHKLIKSSLTFSYQLDSRTVNEHGTKRRDVRAGDVLKSDLKSVRKALNFRTRYIYVFRRILTLHADYCPVHMSTRPVSSVRTGKIKVIPLQAYGAQRVLGG